MNKNYYIAGVGLGIFSAVGSTAIAIILSADRLMPTDWVLLIQSLVALLVSCALPGLSRLYRRTTVKRQRSGGWLGTSRYGRHLIRAVAGLAIYAFYYRSLKLVPKVDCSLLLNTAPLFVPIMCIIAFRDRVAVWVWTGVLIGFAGVSTVLLPTTSFESLGPGHFLGLLAGLCFAWSTVMVRDLNRTERVTTTVLYYNLHSVVCLLAVLSVTRSAITWQQIEVCLLVGMVFCAKQYAITFSVKFASATTAAMLNFCTIPLLALYTVLAEHKDVPTTVVVGGVLVAVGSFSALAGSTR